MYDDVRAKDESDIDFDMTPSQEIRGKTGISYGFDNWSTRWLYLVLLVIFFFLW